MIPEASSGLRLAAASRVQSSRRLLLCPGSFWSVVFFGINEWTSKKTIHSVFFFFFADTSYLPVRMIFPNMKQCETTRNEGYDMMLIRSTATMNNYLGQKIKIVLRACSCAFYLNMQCSCWAEWCHETSTGHGTLGHGKCSEHSPRGWIHRLLRLLS